MKNANAVKTRPPQRARNALSERYHGGRASRPRSRGATASSRLGQTK
ncbi:hypothetical protein RKD47_002397 [Streptomyces albogriseolus]